MAAKQITARSLAMESLIALERDGRYSNLEIDSRLKKAWQSGELSDADRSLYTRLVYGVTERRITLDYIISRFSAKAPEALDGDVKIALRLGIYQLRFMDRIPEHAAVGETVELVAKPKKGYVNAVLRSYIRAGKPFCLPDKADEIHFLSVKYSVPEPLCRHYAEECGREELEDLLAALCSEPKTGLRVNTLRITPDEAAQMTGGTVDGTDGLVLVDGLDERAKAGLDDGLWFVQDKASRISTVLLGARPGDTVVDTCACPGGKSFSAAMDMENKGRIYSFDIHENKLPLIERGAGRLGITIIETEARDARNPRKELLGKADRVICDAPCSGLGVIAKKPDIRYKDLASIARLPEVQYGVLTGASGYVRDGGVLLYSTCTLNRAENGAVVERFISANGEFSLVSERTFMPHRDGCDGFYAAVMIKNNAK